MIAAAVLAFAGIAWFGWSQDDPPSSWVPCLAAGSVVSVLLLVALVILLVRHGRTTGSPMADPRVRRGYGVTVALEVALMVGGHLLLAAVGHASRDAAWRLFVVGVHFVPLARIFHARGLALTGVAVAVVAAAAAYLGLATDLAPSATAGAGGGVVFIVFSAWVLAGERFPGRRCCPLTVAPKGTPVADRPVGRGRDGQDVDAHVLVSRRCSVPPFRPSLVRLLLLAAPSVAFSPAAQRRARPARGR